MRAGQGRGIRASPGCFHMPSMRNRLVLSGKPVRPWLQCSEQSAGGERHGLHQAFSVGLERAGGIDLLLWIIVMCFVLHNSIKVVMREEGAQGA